MNNKILIIEDEKDLAWAISEKLEKEGYEISRSESGEEGLGLLAKTPHDLVILDYLLPGKNGIEVLGEIKRISPTTSVTFITAHGDHDLAWKCLELGADEYINKPFNLENLSFLVYKILKQREKESEWKIQGAALTGRFPDIAWRSQAMDEILSRIDNIARGSAPLLITGETGTGKELLASAIHNHENNLRKDKPFLTVNCAAVPENLIESELFGHTRGAFSGALIDRPGAFEAADRGTVFLDELTSTSPAFQAKLLRVLDTGEFTRAGDVTPRATDVFIIAATNRDLEEEVAAGNFRDDLFHRLKALSIDIPPLRDRREDIEPLVDYFIALYSEGKAKKPSLDKDALKALREYPWPGNTRELKNTIQSLLIQKNKSLYGLEDLPERITESQLDSTRGTFTNLKADIVENFERRYFSALLAEAHGNVSEVARLADMARVHLIRKLKALGLDPKKFKR